ncbi:MAG: hypothetical protein JJU20_13900 [Opitutales bacterium]|nr:hypothetical protein [Opitutales bacterium]
MHYDAYHSLQSDVDRLMFDLRNHRRSLVLSLGNSSVEERQAALKSHYESFENEYAQLELLLSKRAHHRRQAKEELRSYNAIGSDLKSGNEQHYLPSDLIESGGSPEEIKSLILAERLSARVEAEISDLVDMAEAKGE